MTNWQEDRQKKIAEIVTDTYLICFMLVLVPVMQYFSFKLNYSIKMLLVLSLVICVILAIAILYTKKVAMMKTDFAISYKVFDIALIVIFLAVTVFVIHRSSSLYPEILFVVPVLVATVGFSRRSGALITVGIAAVAVVSNLFLSNESLDRVTVMDLVIAGTIILVGWLVGELIAVEKESRDRIMGTTDLDDLTALYNHRFFQEYLRHHIRAVDGKGEHFSVVIFDLDHFRHYNEICGHANGDKVLKQIGRLLSGRVKAPAIAARTGGDQFALILPAVTEQGAAEMAGRIQEEIESIQTEGFENRSDAKVSVSTGVAAYPQHGRSAEELLRAVDYALYKAQNHSMSKLEIYFNVFDSMRGVVSGSGNQFHTYAKVLLSIINSKDHYTFGHSERVLDYAAKIADYIGLLESDRELLLYAAYLHDVGKVNIESHLLNKAESLCEEEWSVFKRHPLWGRDIIVPFMSDVTVGLTILHHHENFDGTGYPQGISGEAIPFLSRVLRVVDSFDAMTTDRPYKAARTARQALDEILAGAGTLYDPQIAVNFVSMMEARTRGIA